MACLSLKFQENFARTISPLREVAAYEALWQEKGASFKVIADMFRGESNASPSELVPAGMIEQLSNQLERTIRTLPGFGVRINGTADYPRKLLDAAHPLEVLYYQGDWDLAESPSVAVVGARKVSEEGKRRTQKLVKALVKDNYTIVSGLAEGVDTIAHNTALEEGGRTIAVIGTPLDQTYPKVNAELQKRIASEHLLISQVPFIRYRSQDYRINRSFFPERNVTMSALTKATVIVEASDTSGTLFQARAAIRQGRKLFILDSCFKNPAITWPAKYEAKGAIRVSTYQDIKNHLSSEH